MSELNEIWYLLLALGYAVIIYIGQKLFELLTKKRELRYEIYNRVFAEKRIERIDKLYIAVYEFECFVKKYLIKNPEFENFDNDIANYYNSFDRTRDELELSYLYLQDKIYQKAYEFLLQCDKALMPASKKAHARQSLDSMVQNLMPYKPDSMDEFTENIRESIDELDEIKSKVIETRKELRNLIQKNRIFR